MDAVRRQHWSHLRKHADPEAARAFKGPAGRWAKNPDDLTCPQDEKLAAIRRTGGATWRAYKLKEALRAIFDRDLEEGQVTKLPDRWLSWAQRSGIEEFVKLGRTIRALRDGSVAAFRLGGVQRPGRRDEQ